MNVSESHIEWANKFLKNYRENPGPFNYKPTLTEGDGFINFEDTSTAFHRLLRNIWLKIGIEKHNQMISLWIRVQVHFQHLFLPVRGQLFKFVEKYKIKPLPVPAEDYDFFPYISRLSLLLMCLHLIISIKQEWLIEFYWSDKVIELWY